MPQIMTRPAKLSGNDINGMRSTRHAWDVWRAISPGWCCIKYNDR